MTNHIVIITIILFVQTMPTFINKTSEYIEQLFHCNEYAIKLLEMKHQETITTNDLMFTLNNTALTHFALMDRNGGQYRVLHSAW